MPVFIPSDKPKRVSMDQINFERNIIEKLEKADINNDGLVVTQRRNSKKL